MLAWGGEHCGFLMQSLIAEVNLFFLMIILNAVPQYINLSSDKGSLKDGIGVVGRGNKLKLSSVEFLSFVKFR